MLKKILLSLTALSIAMFGIVSISPVFAETPAQQSCAALKLQDPSVDCTPTNKVTESKQVNNLLKNIINVLSIIVGAVAVLMIIIGGFRYVISGGDSNNTKGAKDTILYAVIGLVVVIFAQVIVRFVLTEATKK